MKLFYFLLMSALFPACRDDKDSSFVPVQQENNCTLGATCFTRDPSLDVANFSLAETVKSHNIGQNCMKCHQIHGPGKGLFSIAGSIFSETQDKRFSSQIRVFSDAARTQEVLAVPVDALGNFYTTMPLPVPAGGYFVSIDDAETKIRHDMPFPTLSLACNICHAGNGKLELHE